MSKTEEAMRGGLGRRKPGELAFAFAIALIALLIGIRYYGGLWALDENGISPMSSKLPYWDFTNLWAGSRMALEGHVGWLFDVDAYRQALRSCSRRCYRRRNGATRHRSCCWAPRSP